MARKHTPNYTPLADRIAGLKDSLLELRKVIAEQSAVITTLTEDLQLADKLSSDLRKELLARDLKIQRMKVNRDVVNDILQARTTALCALLRLNDPKWEPTAEESTP